MITLDTSAVLAAIDAKDRDHSRIIDMLFRERGPYILPVAILSEITFMIEQDLGSRILEEFLANIAQGQFMLDCGADDWDRIIVLVQRYADFPLGFSDAAVVACGERNGGLVATLDFRHFGAVAREGTIRLAL